MENNSPSRMEKLIRIINSKLNFPSQEINDKYTTDISN